MFVKTFEGFSMKDAMASVKQEFGQDAVILSINEKTLDNYPGKMVEVRAAITESRQNSLEKFPTTRKFKTIEDKIGSMETKINAMADSLVHKEQIHRLESGINELKLLFSEYLRTREGTSLKGLPKYLLPIHQHLKIMGLEQEYIADLMKYLKGIPEHDSSSGFDNLEDFYKSHAMRWMLKRIKIASRWNIVPGNTSIHTFIGPSGSGKTTILGKIAAHYKKNENASVLIVSFDNCRVAASEQLRVYAKILDIPFVTIDRAEDLGEKLLANRNAEIVLIDTSGRNPKDSNDIEDLKILADLSLPINFHLTLAVTERLTQLESAVRHFSQVGLESLIFTKIDESMTYGEIYNISHKWSVPLSFFSSGQKIPGDFEKATRERVVERIFGL
jgi:flagellar biosynthesis protein FlhF